jgi:ATP-dependent Lhr-like helicase
MARRRAGARRPAAGRAAPVTKRATGASQSASATDAETWFAAQGWQPFSFQLEVWAHMAAGRSGLLHATTGAGKTLAAWFGALAVCRAEPAAAAASSGAGAGAGAGATGPRVLWITPMRALAADTTLALQAAADGVGMGWTVEQRTGDTAAAAKARQRKTWPPALVITPESLSLMLAMADSAAVLGGVQVLIVDEWHELLGNKRGTQVLLALARLRRLNPRLRVWGLSATLGNLEEACRALAGEGGVIVRGAVPKAPGPAPAGPGGDRAGGQRFQPGLHQHPLPGRALVPGPAGSTA